MGLFFFFPLFSFSLPVRGVKLRTCQEEFLLALPRASVSMTRSIGSHGKISPSFLLFSVPRLSEEVPAVGRLKRRRAPFPLFFPFPFHVSHAGELHGAAVRYKSPPFSPFFSRGLGEETRDDENRDRPPSPFPPLFLRELRKLPAMEKRRG